MCAWSYTVGPQQYSPTWLGCKGAKGRTARDQVSYRARDMQAFVMPEEMQTTKRPPVLQRVAIEDADVSRFASRKHSMAR
jgi:hypothetical protein